jgi:hypothetical protein
VGFIPNRKLRGLNVNYFIIYDLRKRQAWRFVFFSSFFLASSMIYLAQ